MSWKISDNPETYIITTTEGLFMVGPGHYLFEQAKRLYESRCTLKK